MAGFSISSLAACAACPRRYYLGRTVPSGTGEPSRYTMAKQLSYHIGTPSFSPGVAWEEVCAVSPQIDPALKETFQEWGGACALAQWPPAAEYDRAVSSEKFRIHGRVDRVLTKEPFWAIVRSSTAPERGVWRSDRIRAAALSLCLEEETGEYVDTIAVEYIPSGLSRLCTPEPRDRRAVLSAVKMADRIERGHIPKKPRNAPCETCLYETVCSTGPSSLSERLNSE